MGFPRQEYWSGLPFPSPGDLPDPGIEPASPALKVDSLPLSPQEALIKAARAHKSALLKNDKGVNQSCYTECDV